MFAVLVFSIAAGVAQGMPAPVLAGMPAQGADDENGPKLAASSACWSSGPYDRQFDDTSHNDDQGKDGWGGQHEYASFRRDFRFEVPQGGALLLDEDVFNTDEDDLQDYGLSGRRRPSLFTSFPELIDYAFAMDTANDLDIKDTRVGRLKNILAGSVGENDRVFLPWHTSKGYFIRRSVARREKDRLINAQVDWVNDSLPGGGLGLDEVALMEDRMSAAANLTRGTQDQAVDGSRVGQGETDVTSNQIEGVYVGSCSGEPGQSVSSCDSSWNFASTPVQVKGRNFMRYQSDHEAFNNSFVDNQRRFAVVDEGGGVEYQYFGVHPDDIPDSTLKNRKTGPRGYRGWLQADSSDDDIRVVIELDTEYRSDFKYNVFNDRSDTTLVLPAFGMDVLTYMNIKGARHPGVNDVYGSDAPPLVSVTTEDHLGYRQPTLSQFWSGRGEIDNLADIEDMNTRPDVEHIKWPVNIQDMNWYLYEMPGDPQEEESYFLFWLTKAGASRLARSGYSERGLYPEQLPSCTLKGDGSFDDGNIECDYTGHLGGGFAGRSDEWLLTESTSLVGGADVQLVEYGYYPFDTDQGDFTLNEEMLLRQGVASPLDVEDEGRRDLSHFSFMIREASLFGYDMADLHSADTQRRLGAPRQEDAKENYLKAWPDSPIDPARVHLLVITYYEVLNPDDGADDRVQYRFVGRDESESVRLPERHLRRVVCRLVLLPAGISPVANQNDSVGQMIWSKITGTLDGGIEMMGRWIAAALGAAVKAPFSAMKKGGEVACIGLEKVDAMTALNSSPRSASETRLTGNGVLVLNKAVQSKREGLANCLRMAAPVEVKCDPSSTVVYRGRCTELTQPRLYVERGEFLDLDESGAGVSYGRYETERVDEVPEGAPGGQVGNYVGEVQVGPGGLPTVRVWDEVPGGVGRWATIKVDDARFYPVPADLANDQYIGPHNSGLTRLHLKWEAQTFGLSESLVDAAGGYVVIVYPDEKSSSLPAGEGIGFVLPGWVEITVSYRDADSDDDEDDESIKKVYRRIEGFNVGGLNHYPPGGERVGDSLFDMNVSTLPPVLDQVPAGIHSVRGLGSVFLTEQYKAFNALVGNLPLAHGFVHGFAIAPYTGEPDFDFFVGPESDIVYVDGGKAACYSRDPGTDNIPENVLALYNCAGQASPGQGVEDQGDEPFRFGLLSLTGTEICDDIFSSTPPGFTWANPVVKNVWGLMWIIAGGVLFSLLVWQGLRMTYDIWIDPQPAVGLRELVPRFLLAIALGAGSLVLCQMVLVVASDLTCFVAQMTGMEMWGVIGVTMGGLLEGFLAWEDAIVSGFGKFDFFKMLKTGLLFIVLAIVIVIFLVIILGLFIKVALGMLMRTALLAVLIAVSPLAFAFYASDSTSHWTKRWVSMFLGTTFQQVVVLVVIYLGANVMGAYLADGVATGLPTMVVGMILAVLTLALADKVPGIVNPTGQGMFDSLGGMAKMGGMVAAGGLMAASMGVGVVGGAARGAIAPPKVEGGGSGGGGSPAGPSGQNPPQSPGSGGTPASNPVGGLAGQNFAGGGRAASSSSSGGAAGPGGGAASPGGGDPDGGGDSGGGGVVVSSPGGESSPGGGEAGSGGGRAGSGADEGGGEKRQGRMSSALQGAWGGGRRGARWAGGVNRRMSDVSSGNFLYRHGSGGDDAAAEVRRARKDQGKTFNDMLKELKKMSGSDESQT